MIQQGVARSVRLFRLFLREQSSSHQFYSNLARDAVSQVAAYGEMAGKTVVDVGGGPGYFTAAFRAAGAECYLFEPRRDALLCNGAALEGAVLADGYWLPVRDGCADICFSSNALEHVADPIGLIGEMVRVTRPGGLVYLSFTIGSTLYPLHIGTVLRLVRSVRGAEIVDALPRYYPSWCRFVVRIPWLREVLTWNLLLVLRRTE